MYDLSKEGDKTMKYFPTKENNPSQLMLLNNFFRRGMITESELIRLRKEVLQSKLARPRRKLLGNAK